MPSGFENVLYNRPIFQVDRVFASGMGDLGSVPGRAIPKTQKMLFTQHYKVWIKSKVDQFREWSSTLPYISV